MKKILLFLTLALLTVNSFGATPPFKPQTDEMILGKGANTLDKFLTFDVGDGVANPQILIDDINKIFEFNKNLSTTGNVNAVDGTFSGVLSAGANDATFGDGTNTDKKHIFDIGAGASNPYLGYSATSNALVFNNGLSEKKFGTGSGGGGGGINFILNNSFEDAGSPILNWSNLGGTFTQEDHVNGREGNEKFARFVATTIGQYFESDAVTISDDVGPGCMADFKYMQGDNAFEYKVLKAPYADPADVVAIGTISDLTEFDKAPTVVFNCQGGDQFKFRVTSTAAGTIDADGEVYLGSNKGYIPASSSEKVETKFLAAQASSTGILTDLTFSNLTVGKRYKLRGQITGNIANGSENSKQFGGEVYNGGTSIVTFHSGASNVFNFRDSAPILKDFVASSTTITVDLVTLENATISAGSANTYLTLTEVINETQAAISPEQAEFYIEGRILNTVSDITIANSNQIIVGPNLELQMNKGAASITCVSGASNGSTCATDSEQMGFSFNVPVAGRYQVCFSIPVRIGNASVGALIRHTQNGSDTNIKAGQNYISRTHSPDNSNEFYLDQIGECEVFDFTVGENTVKMQAGATGTNRGIPVTGTHSFAITDSHFSVKLLQNEVARPIVNNMVDTKRKDGLRVEGCFVKNNGTATADPESNLCESWVNTLTRNTIGYVSIVTKVGVFSKDPVCSISNDYAGSTIGNKTQVIDNANIDVRLFNTAGSLLDENFFIVCIGAK
jgi:hypothetical protein